MEIEATQKKSLYSWCFRKHNYIRMLQWRLIPSNHWKFIQIHIILHHFPLWQTTPKFEYKSPLTISYPSLLISLTILQNHQIPNFLPHSNISNNFMEKSQPISDLDSSRSASTMVERDEQQRRWYSDKGRDSTTPFPFQRTSRSGYTMATNLTTTYYWVGAASSVAVVLVVAAVMKIRGEGGREVKVGRVIRFRDNKMRDVII